jgi:hypothetical protein
VDGVLSVSENIWPLEFDALNYSFRRAKEGVVIGFVVHPTADCISILAAAELGFRYKITLEPQSAGPAEVVPIAKARKRPETEGEKAVMRCGILCRDTQFQLWMSSQYPACTGTIDDAVRDYCGVRSRAQIATSMAALAKFYELENSFREWSARR